MLKRVQLMIQSCGSRLLVCRTNIDGTRPVRLWKPRTYQSLFHTLDNCNRRICLHSLSDRHRHRSEHSLMNGLNASVNFKCTAAPWARAKSQALSQPVSGKSNFLNFQLGIPRWKKSEIRKHNFFTNTVGTPKFIGGKLSESPSKLILFCRRMRVFP